MPKNLVSVTVLLPADLVDRVQRISKASGLSLDEITEVGIEQQCDELEKYHGLEETDA